MRFDNATQPMAAAALRVFYAHDSVEASVQQAALPTIAAGILHARLQGDDLFYEQGILASCAAARHITSFNLRCTADQRHVAVDRLLHHLTANERIRQEFEQQKKQALRRAAQSSWKARLRAEHRLRQRLYGPDHAYGWTQAGDYAAIEQMTCDQVVAWLKEMRANLLVVFADDRDQFALNESSEGSGFLVATDRLRTPKILPMLTAAHVHLTCCSNDEACDASGAIGPPHGHEDFEPAQLANLLLHKVGMMGRLGGWYRAHGLAYECGAAIEGGWGPGLWKLYAVFPRRGDNAQASQIPGILDRFLHSPIPEDELEAARRMRLQQRWMNQADSEGRAAQLAQSYLLLTGPEDDSLQDLLSSIHSARIRDVVSRYWSANRN